MDFGEDLKKLFLAGVGATAVTAEKSEELLNKLVERGELTVEQGKVLNQELRHTVKEKTEEFKEKAEELKSKAEDAVKESDSRRELADMVASLNDDQLKQLRQLLDSFKDGDEAE